MSEEEEENNNKKKMMKRLKQMRSIVTRAICIEILT
jgi:hypothetical protein